MADSAQHISHDEKLRRKRIIGDGEATLVTGAACLPHDLTLGLHPRLNNAMLPVGPRTIEKRDPRTKPGGGGLMD